MNFRVMNFLINIFLASSQHSYSSPSTYSSPPPSHRRHVQKGLLRLTASQASQDRPLLPNTNLCGTRTKTDSIGRREYQIKRREYQLKTRKREHCSMYAEIRCCVEWHYNRRIESIDPQSRTLQSRGPRSIY